MIQADKIKHLLDDLEKQAQDNIDKIVRCDETKSSEEQSVIQLDIHSIEFLRET